MNPIDIPGTRNTPAIKYFPERAAFHVVGNSVPENTGAFYAPVVDWLQQHGEELPHGCTFAFSLPYFNSSSLKALGMVLSEIKKGMDRGLGFLVRWHVEEGDEFMMEAGESYQKMLGMEIQITEGLIEN